LFHRGRNKTETGKGGGKRKQRMPVAPVHLPIVIPIDFAARRSIDADAFPAAMNEKRVRGGGEREEELSGARIVHSRAACSSYRLHKLLINGINCTAAGSLFSIFNDFLSKMDRERDARGTQGLLPWVK
jgi:hypothetical protein